MIKGILFVYLFDSWFDSPFRMESVYRRWIHERKDAANSNNGTVEVSDELLRELQTVLGTAKWQVITTFYFFLWNLVIGKSF